MGALVIGGHLEGTAGAGGGLFEDEGDVLADQLLALVAVPLGRFEVARQVEQEDELVRREIELFDKAPVVQVYRHSSPGLTTVASRVR